LIEWIQLGIGLIERTQPRILLISSTPHAQQARVLIGRSIRGPSLVDSLNPSTRERTRTAASRMGDDGNGRKNGRPPLVVAVDLDEVGLCVCRCLPVVCWGGMRSSR